MNRKTYFELVHGRYESNIKLRRNGLLKLDSMSLSFVHTI